MTDTYTEGRAYSACLYGIDAERNHDHGGDPIYNESVYFNFIDPVAKLAGLLRIGNRPTLGYKEIYVNLLMPGGSIAVRAGRERSEANDDFSSQGLEVEFAEPTRQLAIRYDGSVRRVAVPSLMAHSPAAALRPQAPEPCEIDLRWSAACPIFTYDPSGSGDCTPGESVIAADHYEQFGTVSGTVRVGSRTWGLDGASSMRDHSWGPREWSSFTGEWLCAYLADGTAMTLYGEQLPNGERATSGAVWFEGKQYPVTSFQVFTEYQGEATYDGRYKAVVKADGLPAIPLDGTLSHFVPVSQQTAERRVRMSQMNIEFVGGAGGWAIGEFIRPYT